MYNKIFMGIPVDPVQYIICIFKKQPQQQRQYSLHEYTKKFEKEN